jgi:dynein heavy chain
VNFSSLNFHSEQIVTFLDKDASSLLFYINAREDLVATTKYPNSNKRRAAFFLKKGRGAITDKISQDLIMADLSGSTLDHLSTILEEVYLPLLSNTKNVDSWPEVVANDVVRHFHKLNGSVYVISGQAKVFHVSTSICFHIL